MNLAWTRRSQKDIERLWEFIAESDPKIADKVVAALVSAPSRLLEFPRLGERLDAYSPREVRRLIISEYEIRYEIKVGVLIILQVWHTREDR